MRTTILQVAEALAGALASGIAIVVVFPAPTFAFALPDTPAPFSSRSRRPAPDRPNSRAAQLAAELRGVRPASRPSLGNRDRGTVEGSPGVARIDAEERRLGGRRRSAGALTPTESRVAELAAQGLRNAEIASRLHVTRKTVEATLSRVYRKLGVRSRTELARRDATRDEGPGSRESALRRLT